MTPWVTRLLIANVAMFFLTHSIAPGLQDALDFLPAAVAQRPWSPITYMFLHANLQHIFFNMLALFFVGPRVEQRMGSPNFIALYFLSGLGGAALSFLTPNAPIVGASGAIMGLMLTYARYWPRDRFFIYGVLPVEARVLVVLYTAYSIFGGIMRIGNTAHYAHLGGFVGGYLYLLWLEHHSPANEFRRRVQGPRRGTPDGDDVRRWESIDRTGLHELNVTELDRLLAKIRASGAKNLTPDERAYLDRLSARS